MTGRLPTSRWAIGALLLVVAVALRGWSFGNPVVHIDEQYYLLVGDRMLHGAWPYLDLWDRKPPGLFALFAAMRLLPGNGILAYQLVATLFVAATAFLVLRAAKRIGASRTGQWFAAVAYIVWLPLFSGDGGQAPIFYNLPVTGAFLLSLRLPSLAQTGRRRAIIGNGILVCLLGGLAIQLKYTAAIEAALFGLAHVVYLRRAGARSGMVAGALLLWLAIGIAPTLAALGIYAARGSGALATFWFANFVSIVRRAHYSYPVALIAARLLGIAAQLSPLALGAVATLRRQDGSAERRLAAYWLVAALIAFASISTFFDHYALPLVAPLTVLAAPAFGRHWRIALAVLALGVITYGIKLAARPNDRAGVEQITAIVADNAGGACPYVFTGDTIVYHLAHACIPTRYAFPSLLAYAPEQGATGVDEAAEVRRILSTRPPVIITTDRPLAAWNEATHALVAATLRRDYRPVFIAPREDFHTIAYLRRDRPFITTTATPPAAR